MLLSGFRLSRPGSAGEKKKLVVIVKCEESAVRVIITEFFGTCPFFLRPLSDYFCIPGLYILYFACITRVLGLCDAATGSYSGVRITYSKFRGIPELSIMTRYSVWHVHMKPVNTALGYPIVIIEVRARTIVTGEGGNHKPGRCSKN